MPSFSAVCQRILNSPEAQERLLVGGLVSMVPVVNLVSMGYLVQYARRVRAGQLDLPRWQDVPSLARDGIFFLVIALVWAGIPAVLGLSLAWMAQRIDDVLFSWWPLLHWAIFMASWLPLVLSQALGVPLAVVALLRYADSGALGDALEFADVLRALRDRLSILAVPTLAAYGIVAVLWPLYGFAFFIATLAMVAYYGLAIES